MTPDSDDPRATFDYFSAEYAQALQALQTIEAQAPTLLLMGHHDELRQFVDQFVEMARRTQAQAFERNEANFVEWFEELVAKAEKLRAGAGR
jgi:predicted MPP superfamily phosphohydrolase